MDISFISFFCYYYRAIAGWAGGGGNSVGLISIPITLLIPASYHDATLNCVCECVPQISNGQLFFFYYVFRVIVVDATVWRVFDGVIKIKNIVEDDDQQENFL